MIFNKKKRLLKEVEPEKNKKHAKSFYQALTNKKHAKSIQ